MDEVHYDVANISKPTGEGTYAFNGNSEIVVITSDSRIFRFKELHWTADSEGSIEGTGAEYSALPDANRETQGGLVEVRIDAKEILHICAPGRAYAVIIQGANDHYSRFSPYNWNLDIHGNVFGCGQRFASEADADNEIGGTPFEGTVAASEIIEIKRTDAVAKNALIVAVALVASSLLVWGISSIECELHWKKAVS
jgi:hypothetical protein